VAALRHLASAFDDLDLTSFSNDMTSEFTIVFEPAEEGGYTAYIPEVPGAISEGNALDEAREMVLDLLHDLTVYRREAALSGKVPNTLIERFAPCF